MYGFETYSKGREDMYSILEPYMDDAIRNARKLDAVNQGRTPAMSAPGTYVLEVAEVENLFFGRRTIGRRTNQGNVYSIG